MFMVSDEVATVIRRTYEESGEFAAAVELRRHFPGIADNENARRCARMIAGWGVSAPAAATPSDGASPEVKKGASTRGRRTARGT